MTPSTRAVNKILGAHKPLSWTARHGCTGWTDSVTVRRWSFRGLLHQPSSQPIHSCEHATTCPTHGPTPARTAKPFSQADLGRLLAQVNAARPDRQANKRINSNRSLNGLARAYVDCAGRWLAIPIHDFPKYGLELPPPEAY